MFGRLVARAHDAKDNGRLWSSAVGDPQPFALGRPPDAGLGASLIETVDVGQESVPLLEPWA